jgi:hypothetical protein
VQLRVFKEGLFDMERHQCFFGVFVEHTCWVLERYSRQPPTTHAYPPYLAVNTARPLKFNMLDIVPPQYLLLIFVLPNHVNYLPSAECFGKLDRP